MDWEPKVSAILCLFIPGMQGGQAAADILFGRVNPSGKLPLTFPRRYRDCPSFGNFPGYNSEVWYGEGIYVGYRYYEKKGIDVMYPFGYGLSYTSFEITQVSAPASVNVDEEPVCVRVKVKNTGAMAGAEVIQLYLHDVVSTLDKPLKELKAFKKVYLEAGQEKEIILELTKEDFAGYDVRLAALAAEPGEYELMIGNSSADIQFTLKLEVLCENPYRIGARTDIVKIVSNPKALEAVERISGVRLRDVAGSYIVFQPLTMFEQVWRECVVPAIGADEETSDHMLKQIYKEWETV